MGIVQLCNHLRNLQVNKYKGGFSTSDYYLLIKKMNYEVEEEPEEEFTPFGEVFRNLILN